MLSRLWGNIVVGKEGRISGDAMLDGKCFTEVHRIDLELVQIVSGLKYAVNMTL